MTKISAIPNGEKSTPAPTDLLEIEDASGDSYYMSLLTMLGYSPPYIPTYIEGLEVQWDAVDGLTVKTGRCFAEDGSEIVFTSDASLSSMSLSNSTWYHVYAYLSGSTPSIEAVTTAPTAWKNGAYSKTGATSRRLLFSAKTDASGNLYRWKHDVSGGRVIYLAADHTSSPFRLVNGGTATTATSIDATALIPSLNAKSILIEGLNNSDKTIRIGSTSGLSSSSFIYYMTRGDVSNQFLPGEVPVFSGVFYYKFDSAVGSGAAYIDVVGYSFER